MPSIPNLVTVDLDHRSAPGAAQSASIDPIVSALAESLSSSGARATFFATKPVAEQSPAVLKELAEAGHEVACLTTLSPSCRTPYCSDFRSHLRETKDAVETATGVRSRGHRAAGFSVDYASEWAYDVLVDEGFEYDSSRLPKRRGEYGYEKIPDTLHAVRRWGGTLLEVPATTADIFAMRLQLGTASSVRSVPLPLWKAIAREHEAAGDPLVLHLRAQDLWRKPRPFARRAATTDPDAKTMRRISGICGAASFTSIASVLSALMQSAPVIQS